MYIVAVDFSSGHLIHSELHVAPLTDQAIRGFLGSLAAEVYGPSDVWPADVRVVEVFQSRSRYGVGRNGSRSTNYGVR